MENNLQGTNKGFSLVELAVALVILGIMASVMVISPNVAKQTAKHEADNYIYVKWVSHYKSRLYLNLYSYLTVSIQDTLKSIIKYIYIIVLASQI